MNPSILPPARDKVVDQTGLFNLGMTTSQGEKTLNSNLLNSA